MRSSSIISRALTFPGLRFSRSSDMEPGSEAGDLFMSVGVEIRCFSSLLGSFSVLVLIGRFSPDVRFSFDTSISVSGACSGSK